MDNPMPEIPPQQPQPVPGVNSLTENKLELWGRTRLGFLILGILGLSVLGKMCGNKKKGIDNVPGQTVKIMHPGNVKIPVTSTKIETHYIPPEGGLTITPKDSTKSIDDLVKIHYKEIGWTFEPGIELSGNLSYSYGIDAKLFYAYRFGIGMGIVGGSNVTTVLSPDLFISYRLDQLHFRNTEAIVTYVPTGKIPFGIGIRINL